MMNLKNIDRRLSTILLIVFVQMLGGAMVLPVLPLYAQRDFGLTPPAITLLVSSYFMALFFAGPWLGRLSDTRGRLPVLIVSLIGTVLSFVMMALANSAWMLFAARILDGVTGGNLIVAQAYVTDITPREQRTEKLGKIFAVFGLGFIFGPAIGGFVSANWGEHASFWVAAALTLVTVIIAGLALDETITPEQQSANRTGSRASMSPAAVAQNPPLVLILFVSFIVQFGLGILQSTFALYGDAVLFAGYDEATTNMGIGLILAVVGVTQFITQTFLLRPMLRRFSEVWLVVTGSIVRALGAVFYALANSPWSALPASIAFPFGIGITMPSLQSLATRTVPDHMRGGVLGVYQSSISLGVIFGTAFGGVLFEVAPQVPYWVAAGSGVFAILAALLLLRQSRVEVFETPIVAPGD
ncbi:MAG TPA: MFS transporter [Anaerolineales bacterium]|nr:MFS transporter [Anaerolineales bacterium]